jgi:hypothetical protein
MHIKGAPLMKEIQWKQQMRQDIRILKIYIPYPKKKKKNGCQNLPILQKYIHATMKNCTIK